MPTVLSMSASSANRAFRPEPTISSATAPAPWISAARPAARAARSARRTKAIRSAYPVLVICAALAASAIHLARR